MYQTGERAGALVPPVLERVVPVGDGIGMSVGKGVGAAVGHAVPRGQIHSSHGGGGRA